MAVAIGIVSCGSHGCYPADDEMGTILFNGKFNPVYHEYYMPPYQNYTVKVPSTFTEGTAHINVAHVSLIGVSIFFPKLVLWHSWINDLHYRLGHIPSSRP